MLVPNIFGNLFAEEKISNCTNNIDQECVGPFLLKLFLAYRHSLFIYANRNLK